MNSNEEKDLEKINKLKIVNFVSTVCIVIIIWELSKIFPKFMRSAQNMEFDTYNLYRYFFVVGPVVIGSLLEIGRVLKSLKVGFKIQWISLIFSIILISTLLLSHDQGIMLTGLGRLYNIMQYGVFRSILGIVGGVHITRAFTGNIEL